jgi:transglutaminase-like putative cysteine protease
VTRYRLTLAIRYRFDRPTGGGRQLLRVIPAHRPGLQEVEQARLTLTPAPLEQARFADFFGTQVAEIVLPAGLGGFEARLEAVVARHAQPRPRTPAPGPSPPGPSPPGPRPPGPRPPEPGDDLPLADLPAALRGLRGLGPEVPHHYLAPSPRIPADLAIATFAARATAGATTVAEAVARLGRAVHRAITFDPGATAVDTPVAQAFAQRRGVCQDMAQIMIAGLRAQGIPAAYVGGYLRTTPPPGTPRLVGADAMHAWVAAWCGPALGWVEHDPTNDRPADGDHIAVGRGRDYADVAPVTGTLRLDGGQAGHHSVDLTAL